MGSLQGLSGHLVYQQPRNQSLKCGAGTILSFRLVCLAAACFVGALGLYLYRAVLEPHVWRKSFSIYLLHLSTDCKGQISESHEVLKSSKHLFVPYLKIPPNWRTLSKVVDLFALETALIETASVLESFHHATPEQVPLRDPSFQCLYLAEPLYGCFYSDNL